MIAFLIEFFFLFFLFSYFLVFFVFVPVLNLWCFHAVFWTWYVSEKVKLNRENISNKNHNGFKAKFDFYAPSDLYRLFCQSVNRISIDIWNFYQCVICLFIHLLCNCTNFEKIMVPYILPFPDFDLFCEGKFCLFIKSLAIIIRQLCLEGSHYMPQYTIIIIHNKLIQCNFTWICSTCVAHPPII